MSRFLLFEDSSSSEEGETPDIETTKTESHSLFCICCLQGSAPYISLLTCWHADFLNSFAIPEIKPLNQVICYQCHGVLKKIKLFKQQVEDSLKLLQAQEHNRESTYQRLNILKATKVIDINIPPANTKNINNEHKITTENNSEDIFKKNQFDFETTTFEPKAKHKKNINTPNSMHNKVNKIKNVHEALKIINSNKNNDCINFLATSLQSFATNQLTALTNVLLSDNHTITKTPCNDKILRKSLSKDTEIPSRNADTTNNFEDFNMFKNIITTYGTHKTKHTYIPNNTTSQNIEISNCTNKINEDNQTLISTSTVTNEIIEIPEDTEMISDSENVLKDTMQSQSADGSDKNDIELPLTVNEEVGIVNEITTSSMDGATNESNIKYIRITRHDLMLERSLISTSKAYLDLAHHCENCLVGFRYKENLEDHLKRKHSQKPLTLTCDVCLQVLESSESYNDHTDRHYTRFECPCGVRFSSFDEAFTHCLKRQESKHVDKCPKCPYGTSDKGKYNRHINKCGRVCKICGIRFKTSRKLKVHTKKKHDNLLGDVVRRPTASIIDGESKQRCSNKEKVAQNKNIIHQCKVCGKIFKQALNLQIHCLRIHPCTD